MIRTQGESLPAFPLRQHGILGTGQHMDHTLSPKDSWFDRGRAEFARGMLLGRGRTLDDALRVLSIVSALHAAGYQRARACGLLAPSGLH